MASAAPTHKKTAAPDVVDKRHPDKSKMAQQPPQAQPRPDDMILQEVHKKEDSISVTANYGDKNTLYNVDPDEQKPEGVMALTEIVTKGPYFAACYKQVVKGLMACKDEKQLKVTSISASVCVRFDPANPDERFDSQTMLADDIGDIGASITYSDKPMSLDGLERDFVRVWRNLEVIVRDYDRIHEAIPDNLGNPDRVRLVVASKLVATFQCKWPGSCGSSFKGHPLA